MGKIQVLLDAGVKRRQAADIAQVTGGAARHGQILMTGVGENNRHAEQPTLSKQPLHIEIADGVPRPQGGLLYFSCIAACHGSCDFWRRRPAGARHGQGDPTNAFEKRAGEAARLKGKAANLLKKVGDIEVAQKAAFDALILKTAYATGLDALPLRAIVAGFAALSEASKPKQEQTPSTDHVQSDDDTIDLIVDIGRNTSKERFAVLDQYLTWNGKDGEWSGRVTKAVLSIFEGLFEARRLKYSKHDLQNAEGGSSNTITSGADNVSNAALGGDPASPESSDAVDVGNWTAGEAVTTTPVPVEPELREAASSEIDEAAGADRQGTAAGSTGQRPGPIHPAAAADDQKPSSRSMAAGLPRSPFAGLRRGGQG
jgi:hypothetical protein